jgi:hypothetical protein
VVDPPQQHDRIRDWAARFTRATAVPNASHSDWPAGPSA